MGSDGGGRRPLRVAQVGCGQISAAHFKAYADTHLVEVAIVVDIDPVAAQEAAAANGGVPWTTNVEEALRRDDVDVVSVATPHYLHAPHAVAALRAGKHVLCEKPLTVTLEDADSMIFAAQDFGRSLGMWMVMRYGPAARAARDLIRDGAIGRIVNVRLPDVHNKAPNYYERGVGGRARPTQWRASRKTAGGGALIMNAIHQIDVLRFITGLEVERVSAEWVNFTGRAEVEDMINVVLRYDNGAIGTIDTANYAPGGGEAHVLRIYGTRGQLQLERSGLKAYVDEPFADLKVGEWQDVPTERARDSRTLLLEDFVRSVATGAPPPVTARDGRAALQTVLAAYEAAERGRTVRLDELASAVAV